MRPYLLATIATLALPIGAMAAPWQVDSAASTLTFTGKQAGEAFTGSFTKFAPTIEFDPLKPETAKVDVVIDMGSATIDDKDKRESLPTKDWFFTEQFPTATFQSTAVRMVSPGKYLADGKLTLRGISKPLQLTFSFTEDKGRATVDGQSSLDRSDFGVGQGQWKDDQWIAYPVEVKFHLVATKG